MPQAGRMDQYLSVESKTTVVNDYLDAVPTWAAHANFWAQVITAKAQEAFAAGALRVTEQVIFRTHYRTDIHEGMRLLWGGTYYDITGVVWVGLGAAKATEIHCVKGARDGI